VPISNDDEINQYIGHEMVNEVVFEPEEEIVIQSKNNRAQWILWLLQTHLETKDILFTSYCNIIKKTKKSVS
jgi:hypothetical protein